MHLSRFTIRAEKDVMHLRLPAHVCFIMHGGVYQKVRSNQHHLHDYAAADDHVPSHQEFHHKLLQETAQQS